MCERNRWVGPDLDMLGPYPVTNMGDSIKKENNYFKTKLKKNNSVTLQQLEHYLMQLTVIETLYKELFKSISNIMQPESCNNVYPCHSRIKCLGNLKVTKIQAAGFTLHVICNDFWCLHFFKHTLHVKNVVIFQNRWVKPNFNFNLQKQKYTHFPTYEQVRFQRSVHKLSHP